MDEFDIRTNFVLFSTAFVGMLELLWCVWSNNVVHINFGFYRCMHPIAEHKEIE